MSSETLYRARLVDVQASFDPIFRELGAFAPPPTAGDTVTQYRRRLLAELQEHSPTWRNVYLEDRVIPIAEAQIREDAKTAATDNEYWKARQSRKAQRDGKPVELHSRKVKNEAGQETTEYFGDPMSWMKKYSLQPRYVLDFGNGLLSKTSRTIRGR